MPSSSSSTSGSSGRKREYRNPATGETVKLDPNDAADAARITNEGLTEVASGSSDR